MFALHCTQTHLICNAWVLERLAGASRPFAKPQGVPQLDSRIVLLAVNNSC